MLEIYFEAAHTLERLKTGPQGRYIDGFAEHLRGAGYTRWTARGYLRAVGHLGTWMQAEAVPIEKLCASAVSAFRDHLPNCRCLRRNSGVYGDAVKGVRHFLDHLRDGGVLPPLPDRVPPERPAVIASFERWMSQHRGVTDSTLDVYRPHLIALLEALGDETHRYSAAGLRAFVSTRASEHGVKRAQLVISSVRMFLRYLGCHGLCDPHLADAIPGVANWRLAALPAYLQPEEVEQLLDSCDTSTAHGLRDRAVLLLLTRLGLRAGEVAQLAFNDIDWRAATVRVTGKSRREARLPLPQEVGDAILAYLEGRPTLEEARIFLRVRAPHGSITRAAVTDLVNRAVARAGVKPPRGGAHVLRHTAATTLLRQGLPLSSVGTVLRHRSLETTAHYAKVDTALLSEVAQPWPLEVPSC